MSTLKVNTIEPYSGGTVSITGGTVTSASYAETANTLTAGDKTIEGMLSINGTDTLDPIISATGSSYLNGNVYVSQGNVDIATGQFIGRRASLSNRVRVEDGTDEGTLRVDSLDLEKNNQYGISLTNNSQIDGQSSIDILAEAFPGAGFLAPFRQITFQRGDAYTDGTITIANPVNVNGNSNLNGSVFISGSNNNPGSPHPLEVQDGNGDFPLLVLNAQTQPLAGYAIGMKNGVNVSSGNLTVNDNSNFNGTVFVSGSNAAGPAQTLIVRDGAGTSRLEVNNQVLSSIVGVDVVLNGAVNVSETLKLDAQDPLPTGQLGMLAVSGSDLYFHNGTSWIVK